MADGEHLEKAKGEMVPRDGWDIPRIGAVERAQAHALIAIAESLGRIVGAMERADMFLSDEERRIIGEGI